MRSSLRGRQGCIGFVLAVSAAACGGPAAAGPETPAVGEDEREASPAVTGIAECDAYLALYRRCESRLAPAIAAGDLRSYEAEAASLRYFATTAERAGMPAACRAMQRDLRERCR
jgi:hypothetical protein